MSATDIESVRAEMLFSISLPSMLKKWPRISPIAAGAPRLLEFVALDHAGRQDRGVGLHRADADDAQRRLDPHLHDRGDAALFEEDRAVLDGIGVERQGQDIGLGAGALGKPVDDVERRRRIAARQSAQQRHQLAIAGVDLRQHVDAGDERSAVAEADDLVLAVLEREPEETAARQAQGLQGQGLVVEVGANFAKLDARSARASYLRGGRTR